MDLGQEIRKLHILPLKEVLYILFIYIYVLFIYYIR